MAVFSASRPMAYNNTLRRTERCSKYKKQRLYPDRPVKEMSFEYNQKYHMAGLGTQAFSADINYTGIAICGTRASLSTSDPQSLDAESIIHGYQAPEKWWPWQVFVSGDETVCGGTLITDLWVLTAAHCAGDARYVIMGRTNLRQWTVNSQYRTVVERVVHEHFDETTKTNDIALLRLSDSVLFDDYIRPACLPTSNWDFDNAEDCYVTGWGMSDPAVVEVTPQLQMLRVEFMDLPTCISSYETSADIVMQQHVCIAFNQTDRAAGICNGDSGGPLSCKMNEGENYYVAGVASFGEKGCLRVQKPDVYIKVASYINWIKVKILTED